MTFHHIKVLCIIFIAITGINHSPSMDLVEKNLETEDIGSVKVDISQSGSRHRVQSELIDSVNTKILKGKNEKDDVDMGEDIPGCSDNYFRCCISFWRISKGWIDFSGMLTGSAATVLIPLSTNTSFTESQRTTLAITATILTGTSAFLQALRTYSLKQIQEHQVDLREIIVESHGESKKIYRLKAFKVLKD